MDEPPTIETFAPRVGERFDIVSDDQLTIAATLTEATRSTSPPGHTARVPFSIVLTGPHEPVLPQRIYTIQHHDLDALDLFLVPIGPDAQGMRYEAVFG